ncbi:MAG: hypothetical protein U1E60_14695 [Reyranellaceae bacterium]
MSDNIVDLNERREAARAFKAAGDEGAWPPLGVAPAVVALADAAELLSERDDLSEIEQDIVRMAGMRCAAALGLRLAR